MIEKKMIHTKDKRSRITEKLIEKIKMIDRECKNKE